ncbi:TfoX/Sxy family protein [Actinoplanes sp. N902-109]|uniref:TfoX/Sxy family protein n=1 Tax=Actinoplanes sp. (strain N902-109) TaxID=649831 RepID=UPI0003296173|nr:TfoX/Sxy family protein [Actinoplanes sp. N902-109]AGL19973.1 hypothetical protein L083_6463 [Actinoplanes sp. N902-109]
MAYDETLAGRLRELLSPVPGATGKRMFGGLSFLIDGNLTVAVRGADLMVRVGPEATPDALAEPGARPCEMGARTMRGWVEVDGAVLDDETLRRWVDRARAYTATLPAK